MTLSRSADPAAPYERAHFENLLRRYPDIDPEALVELLDFLADGPIIDLGHIKGDPALAAITARVKQEHPARFRTTPMQHLRQWALLLIPFIAICWYVWDYGVH